MATIKQFLSDRVDEGLQNNPQEMGALDIVGKKKPASEITKIKTKQIDDAYNLILFRVRSELATPDFKGLSKEDALTKLHEDEPFQNIDGLGTRTRLQRILDQVPYAPNILDLGMLYDIWQ